MFKKLHTNTEKDNFTNKRLKILVLIACLILFWIVLIQLFSGYMKSSVDKNWDEISKEKTEEQKSVILKLYDSYQKDIFKLSNEITSSPDILKQIQRSESKKLFEEIEQIMGGV